MNQLHFNHFPGSGEGGFFIANKRTTNMKKIGGKSKFNPKTKEWEKNPVKYLEFHCTPEEWEKLGNGTKYLVRDWVRSKDWENMVFEDNVLEDFIRLAVSEIICDRYQLNFQFEGETLKVDVGGAPYPVYIDGADFNLGSMPMKEIEVITPVVAVCQAIFVLIKSVKRYPQYLPQFKSGLYKCRIIMPSCKLLEK